jgi:hypothetical protein
MKSALKININLKTQNISMKNIEGPKGTEPSSTLPAKGEELRKREKEPGRDLRAPNLFIEKNRFTATFIAAGEVASIHYDVNRQEIFYKGHNIRNMNLSEAQTQWLLQMTEQLKKDLEGYALADSYEKCLLKILHR